MTSVLSITFIVVCVGSGTVFSLKCLTSKSKQDFSKARTALRNLENFMKSQASSINSKIHALDMDMTAMEKDFDNRSLKCHSGIQWMQYNKHCYHIEMEGLPVAEAEKKCKQFGGYLAMIDDESENTWIQKKLYARAGHISFWIGSAKVINGAWTWKHDQTKLGFAKFYSRRPSNRWDTFYQSYNCLAITAGNGKWTDAPCHYTPPYICEMDSCS